MNSLIEEYNAYRAEVLPADKPWPSGVQFMLRGQLGILLSGRDANEIRAFAEHAETNGYFAVERSAIRSMVAEILTD
jgi:hypothetical protein